MKSNKSRLLNIVTLVCFLQALAVLGQPANENLATFQKFVIGEIPVKEAVVFQKITAANGTLINQEWWRCGWQANTWYCQRLKPDANNPGKLVPVFEDEVIGESFTHAWILGHEHIHVMAKADEANSIFDDYGEFPRELMFKTISLGLPRMLDVHEIEEVPIEWSDLECHTIVGTNWDSRGRTIGKTPLVGKLILNERGCPIFAEFPSVGDLGKQSVAYEYETESNAIPMTFTKKYPRGEIRSEFISLELGSNDLVKTDGYAPSLFADMKSSRTVTFWTNELEYEQRDGKFYPSFTAPEPKLGELAPKLQGMHWLNTTNPLTLDGLRGKVVLLDFWGISCPLCLEELPHSEALYNKFRDQGLIVIGVCSGWGEDKKAARILKDRKITFPNLVDADVAIADEKYGRTARSYVLDASPSYVLLDKSGNLVWKSAGSNEPTESQIRKLLELPMAK